jgi:hypothetical protein
MGMGTALKMFKKDDIKVNMALYYKENNFT